LSFISKLNDSDKVVTISMSFPESMFYTFIA